VSLSEYTVLQRWMRRHGLLPVARWLGWAPVHDVAVARAERDMNVRQVGELEDRVALLEKQVEHLRSGDPGGVSREFVYWRARKIR
jgi:cell division protein FtsB